MYETIDREIWISDVLHTVYD